jgi:predicted signal transduction protein with EAL and GGDEF domain
MYVGLPELLLLLFGALIVIPFWQILKKAGFKPALSLLMLVPVANLVVLYYAAFATWKNTTSPSQAANQ